MGGNNPPSEDQIKAKKQDEATQNRPRLFTRHRTFLLPRVPCHSGGGFSGERRRLPPPRQGGSSGLSDCLKSGAVIRPFFQTFPAFVSPSVFRRFKTLSSYGDLNYNHLDIRQALA